MQVLFCNWAKDILPEGISAFVRVYHDFIEATRSRLRRASLLAAARPLLFRSILYFFLLNGVYVIGYVLVEILYGESMLKGSWQVLLAWAVAGVLSLPILIAVIFNVNKLMALLAERVLGSKAKRSFGQGHLAVLFEALSTCLFVSLAGGLFFRLPPRIYQKVLRWVDIAQYLFLLGSCFGTDYFASIYRLNTFF